MSSNRKQTAIRLLSSLSLALVLTLAYARNYHIGYAWGITQCRGTSTNFTWKIKEFTKLLQTSRQRSVRSPQFHSLVDGLRVQAILDYTEKRNAKKNYVAVKMAVYYPRRSELEGVYQLLYLDKKDKEEVILHQKAKFVTSPPENVSLIGKDNFIEIDDIVEKNDPKGMLRDDSLTIMGVFSAELGMDSFSSDCRLLNESLPADNFFTRRLKSFVNNSLYSDFQIKGKGFFIYAHKAILYPRSRTIKAMLDANKKVKAIIIKEAEKNLLLEVVEFIYTGRIDNLKPEITPRLKNIWRIAHLLDVIGLKENCEVQVCSGLTVENTVEAYNLASHYNAQALKTRIIKYIISRFAEMFPRSKISDVINDIFVFPDDGASPDDLIDEEDEANDHLNQVDEIDESIFYL